MKFEFKQRLRKSKVAVITIPIRIMEVAKLNYGDIVKVSLQKTNKPRGGG